MKTSDMFGIAPAVIALMQVYRGASRRTGRTTRLVAALKNGDRVITATVDQAAQLQSLVRQQRLDVEICVVALSDARHKLYGMKPSEGRTYFDHVWLEQYYENAIAHVGEDLAQTADRLSHNPYIPPAHIRYQK